MPTTTEDALHTIIDAYRDLADKLESLIGNELPAVTPAATTGKLPWMPGEVFDPQLHQPDRKPVPNERSAEYEERRQIAWAGFLLFGGLYVLNSRAHRRASDGECRKIAQDAGYSDNRAWGGGWARTTDVDDHGYRRIKEEGMEFLRLYANELELTLPEDLAGLTLPIVP
jgi:hypothetical protein